MREDTYNLGKGAQKYEVSYKHPVDKTPSVSIATFNRWTDATNFALSKSAAFPYLNWEANETVTLPVLKHSKFRGGCEL